MNKQKLTEIKQKIKYYKQQLFEFIGNYWLHITGILFVLLVIYGISGTGGRVDEIKSRAPKDIESRNWKILRYEGYEWGSFGRHGGKVWYHVQDKDNPNIQYRVFVTLWGGELHYHYGSPETLFRVDIKN